MARTIETVEGGGLIIFLLKTMDSLRQLHSITMDVHSRFLSLTFFGILLILNTIFYSQIIIPYILWWIWVCGVKKKCQWKFKMFIRQKEHYNSIGVFSVVLQSWENTMGSRSIRAPAQGNKHRNILTFFYKVLYLYNNEAF